MMIRYVREAALREKNAQGNAIAEERRSVVFPGMELTLNLPCQCLLIVDADLPLEHLEQLPGILGYVPAPASEEQGTAVQLLFQVGHPNDVSRSHRV